MAFFVLLTIFPDNFMCTIYSDSQSLINTYNEIIYNLKPSRNFRRPMFPIWNLIHTWIYELRLNITLLKVKGHSDDIYNNHADKLARRGLSSPVICISPNDIHHNSLALMCFNNNTSTIKHDPRRAMMWKYLRVIPLLHTIPPSHERLNC